MVLGKLTADNERQWCLKDKTQMKWKEPQEKGIEKLKQK